MDEADRRFKEIISCGVFGLESMAATIHRWCAGESDGADAHVEGSVLKHWRCRAGA